MSFFEKRTVLFIDYSMALGNYVQSGKLSFMLPLINSESNMDKGLQMPIDRQKMVTMFKSGTHLLGLSSLMRHAPSFCLFIRNFAERFIIMFWGFLIKK